MKKLAYITIAILLFASCKKEDDLTGTDVKNWYERTAPSDGNDIDTQIYRIWEKYDFGVLYDTIVGFEGNGRVNANGEPIGDKVVITPAQNPSKVVSYRYPLVDLTNATKRAKFIELLTYVEGFVAPFVKRSEINLPGLLIVDDLYLYGATSDLPPVEKRITTYNILREDSRVLTFNLSSFASMNEVDFTAELIAKIYATQFEAKLTAFYGVLETAFPNAAAGYVLWSKSNGGNLTPNYSRAEINPGFKTLWDDMAKYKSTGASPNVTTHREKWVQLRDMCPQVYGILVQGTASLNGKEYIVSGNGGVMPTKQLDQQEYMAYAFKYTEDQFKALKSEFSMYYVCPKNYTQLISGNAKTDGNENDTYTELNVTMNTFPKTMERFRLMKKALLDIGMDTDAMIAARNAQP